MIGSGAPQQKGFLLGHSSPRCHAAPSLIQPSALFALIMLGNVCAYSLDNNKEMQLLIHSSKSHLLFDVMQPVMLHLNMTVLGTYNFFLPSIENIVSIFPFQIALSGTGQTKLMSILQINLKLLLHIYSCSANKELVSCCIKWTSSN